jgi:hypothetical protein
VLKDWKMVLEIIGDVFFSILAKKILNYEVLLKTLGDALIRTRKHMWYKVC